MGSGSRSTAVAACSSSSSDHADGAIGTRRIGTSRAPGVRKNAGSVRRRLRETFAMQGFPGGNGRGTKNPQPSGYESGVSTDLERRCEMPARSAVRPERPPRFRREAFRTRSHPCHPHVRRQLTGDAAKPRIPSPMSACDCPCRGRCPSPEKASVTYRASAGRCVRDGGMPGGLR